MKCIKLFLFFVLGCSSSVFAGTLGPVSSPSMNPTGYFIGIGGSYNFAHLNSTHLGALNVSSGFPPLGLFSGSKNSYSKTGQDFSFEAQTGYFRPFNATNWLWGLEFLYQYSNLKMKKYNADLDVNLVDTEITTRDVMKIGSIKTKVNDTLMLPVFIGHSYQNSFLYAGIGPSVIHTQQKISDVDDTSSAFYVGTLDGFSKSKWVWGGAVQAGGAYYVRPTWFLKLNYTCAFTGNYRINYATPFAAELNSGVLGLHSKQRLVTQEVALSLNKVFAL